MYLTKLLIGTTRGGDPVWVQTRQENAEFYGWSDNFEPYFEGYYRDPTTGKGYIQNARLGGSIKRPGRIVCISRAPSKSSFVAGMNNQFRISTDASLRHYAALAYGTKVDWYWMTTPSGERRSRKQWLALHEAATQ